MRMASPKPMRCIVLSCSPWQSDARVRRTIEALADAGVKVIAVTPRGHDGSDASAISGADPDGVESRSIAPETWTPRRKAASVAAFIGYQAIRTEPAAFRAAGTMPYVKALSTALSTTLATTPDPDRVLILANDWQTLPAACAARDRYGSAIHYDTHELAVSEHASHPLWRVAFPAGIARIERAVLRRGATLSCVSPGIARDMAERYRLPSPPLVVRNIPAVTPLPPRPAGTPMTVLYHGLFKPDRGLLELVESAAHWPQRYRLVLRGHAPNETFGALLAQRGSVLADRVRVEPMVAPDAVVRAANSADIGIFLPDLTSPQNRYALPNKLFEYLAAGLMVIVPAGTDMADVVATHHAGLALDDVSPAALARRLSALSQEDVDGFKQRAHAASLTLQARRDYAPLLDAFGAASGAKA